MHNGNFGEGPGTLILLSGVPGAGKTTFALAMREGLDFVHIESDAVRLELAPNPAFTFRESGAVFARVDAEARKALSMGRHALVDATNLTNKDRRRFLKLAQDLGSRIIAVRLIAPDGVIRQRLGVPREGASRAGIEVFERMRGRMQPMPLPCIVVDSRFSLVPAIDLICRLIDDPLQ